MTGIPAGLTKNTDLSKQFELFASKLDVLIETLGGQTDDGKSTIAPDTHQKDRKGGGLKELLTGGIDLKGLLGGQDFLKGLLGGDDGPLASLLGGKSGSSKQPKIKAKERPTTHEMLALPAESSMGFLLLYWKLDEIGKNLKGGNEDKDAKGKKGLGSFFKGLLEGAAGLALLAGALILFAGAIGIFSLIGPAGWVSALFGMGMFALFVMGAVALAKSVKGEMKNFVELTLGILLLTGSLLLFGLAIHVMAGILPIIPAAIAGLGLFYLFVQGMKRIALSLGEKDMENFVQFGIGIAIMTGSIILFGVALEVLKLTLNSLGPAIPGLVLFGIFVRGMTGVAREIMEPQVKQFIDFGIGVAIMTGTLILFGLALDVLKTTWNNLGAAIPGLLLFGLFIFGIKQLASSITMKDVLALTVFDIVADLFIVSMMLWVGAIDVLGSIPLGKLVTGILILGLSVLVLAAVASVAEAMLELMPGLIVLSIGFAAFSLAMMLWSHALDDLSKITLPQLGEAALVIGASVALLAATSLMATGMILLMPGLVLFSLGIMTFSEAMDKFANVIIKVGSIGRDKVDLGLDGMNRMMTFITNPRYDKSAPVSASNSPGVIQLLSSLGPFEMLSIVGFRLALGPLADVLDKLSTSVSRIARIGNPAVINAAVVGMGKIIDFLVSTTNKFAALAGTGGIPIPFLTKSLPDSIKDFGGALLPFTDVMLKITSVIQSIKDVGPEAEKIAAPKGPLDKIVAFLIATAKTFSGVDTSGMGHFLWFDNKFDTFNKSMVPLINLLDTVVDVIKKVDGISPDQATKNIGGIVAFLSNASKLTSTSIDGGKFNDLNNAMGPLNGAISTLSSIVSKLNGMGNVSGAQGILSTLLDMVQMVAGAATSGLKDSLSRFKDGLSMLGEGVEYFSNKLQKTNPTALSGIAESLKRIADIKFDMQFGPLLELLKHTDDMDKAAMSLERMSRALQPPMLMVADQLSASLAAGQANGSRSDVSGKAGAGTNSSRVIETAVVGMYDLLKKWDDAQSAQTGPQQQQQSGPTLVPITVLARSQNGQILPSTNGMSWKG
jgi:hypothetical protein